MCATRMSENDGGMLFACATVGDRERNEFEMKNGRGGEETRKPQGPSNISKYAAASEDLGEKLFAALVWAVWHV
jgi:hypothetical protein